MMERRFQIFLVLASLLTTVPAHGQENTDRPPGALIIIENNRIRFEGEARVAEGELLPTPQQLRGVIISQPVRELVTALDAPTFDDRDIATRKLIDLRVDDIQLVAALERGDLSPEQRHRLLHIVRERLTNTPRGALGIRMDAGRQGARVLPDQAPNEDALSGVAILEIIPGMPAERVLQVGDRITHINQIKIATSEDLIDLVQTRRPGDTIMLTVQRPQRNEAGLLIQNAEGKAAHQQLDLEITLGTVDDLQDPRVPTAPSRLEIERRRMVLAIMQRYGSQSRELEVIRR